MVEFVFLTFASQIWDAFPPSLPPAMQTGVVPEPGASSSSGATHSTAAKAFATQELPEVRVAHFHH